MKRFCKTKDCCAENVKFMRYHPRPVESKECCILRYTPMNLQNCNCMRLRFFAQNPDMYKYF